MFQDDDVTGTDLTEFLIGVDLEAMPVQGPYLIVLIFEINGTVIILKSPDKGKAVGRAFDGGITGAILAKNNRIVFFAAGDTRVEGVENAIVIGVESRFFVFPWSIGEQIQVLSGGVFARTAGHKKTCRQ
jgi:hypothetical protein